jgi:hypothetical protein
MARTKKTTTSSSKRREDGGGPQIPLKVTASKSSYPYQNSSYILSIATREIITHLTKETTLIP